VNITKLVWPEDRITRIAEHNIHPEEVEDVCFGRLFVQPAKSFGKNPVYYVLGQTTGGQYLFYVVIAFPDGRGFPITARSMTPKEKRRFNQSRRR
jgi:uncharacterized DUF497 family protein